jgi:uncharacterized protein (TIGR02145 family)
MELDSMIRNKVFSIRHKIKKMIKKIAFIFLLGSCAVQAQIGIGIPNPDPSAVLELSSTNKGFVPPRMTTTQRTAITSPAAGLQVYDTTTSSLWYHNGTVWVDTAIGGIFKGSGSLTTNTTVAAGSNTLAFTSTATNGFSVDGTTLSVDAANHAIGIGTIAPASSSILDLTSTNKAMLLPRVTNTAAISFPVDGMLIYDVSSNCLKVYQNSSWTDCLGNVSTPLSTVSAVCTGFSGSYCTAALSGATYVVTITNNDFTSKQVSPQTTDLSLSGITGLNVSAVSPDTVTTINAGASLVVTYTISGVPGSDGTLTGTFSKQGMNCSSTVTVGGTRAVSAASATRTLCINTALNPITHTTTGATGIGTATGLPAGVSAAWADNTITIIGTPTASGTFTYSIPINGCGAAVNATGTITVTPAMAVSASNNPTVEYYAVMTNITHTTTSATGIGIATGLPPGISASWVSNTITISGTPTKEGTFTYSIPLTGGDCVTINATGTITVVCGANVFGVYKTFMCYNLGATDTSGNPNIPVQAIHGDYYQWGSAAVVATASTSAAAISGWNTTANGSWSDSSKTVNDPCPAGFRVPSSVQWYSVINSNTNSRTGSWANNDSNFGSAINFGSGLSLPAAGYRKDTNGALSGRGFGGYYWSSTKKDDAFHGTLGTLVFESYNTYIIDIPTGAYGYSVRCISE